MLVHALQEGPVLCRIIPVVQFTQEVASFLRRLVKNLTIGITHSRLDAAPFCAAVVSFSRTVLGDATGVANCFEERVDASIAAMVRNKSRCLHKPPRTPDRLSACRGHFDAADERDGHEKKYTVKYTHLMSSGQAVVVSGTMTSSNRQISRR